MGQRPASTRALKATTKTQGFLEPERQNGKATSVIKAAQSLVGINKIGDKTQRSQAIGPRLGVELTDGKTPAEHIRLI